MDEARLSKIAHELWQHHKDLGEGSQLSKEKLQKYADKFDCSMGTLIMALEVGANMHMFHLKKPSEDDFLNQDWHILATKDDR